MKFPEHPRANKTNGQIFRSIAAYEAYWGIRIPKGFVIHHIDRNKSNDSKENLQLIKIGDHVRLHSKEKDYKKQNSCLKNGKIVKCANCGKEIYKAKVFLKEENFCSKKCTGIHSRVNKIIKCAVCGKEFNRKRQPKQKCCCRSCGQIMRRNRDIYDK